MWEINPVKWSVSGSNRSLPPRQRWQYRTQTGQCAGSLHQYWLQRGPPGVPGLRQVGGDTQRGGTLHGCPGCSGFPVDQDWHQYWEDISLWQIPWWSCRHRPCHQVTISQAISGQEFYSSLAGQRIKKKSLLYSWRIPSPPSQTLPGFSSPSRLYNAYQSGSIKISSNLTGKLVESPSQLCFCLAWQTRWDPVIVSTLGIAMSMNYWLRNYQIVHDFAIFD